MIFAPDSPVRRAVTYPDQYCWYILASTLDIIVTHKILTWFGGWEVNILADRLIDRLGLWGLILLKYATVIVVVGICDFIGQRNHAAGRRLANAAIVVAAFPVGVGLLQLLLWIVGLDALVGEVRPNIDLHR